MKKNFLAVIALAGALSAIAAPPETPPISGAAPRPAPSQTYVYQQEPIVGMPLLVSPEQAQAVIDRFKKVNEQLGNPRILIYVNRELVDEKSGFRLTGRTERTTQSRGELKSDFPADAARANGQGRNTSITAGGNVTLGSTPLELPAGKGNVNTTTEQVTNENKYQARDRTDPPLADKQTVRDIERLFGRPLRHGGAHLADQRVATQLIADRPLDKFVTPTEGEQARKDREVLAKVADVVLEVLISSRNIVISEVSGDRVHSVPDIHATAIRLSDSRILGQASASDILGKDRYAGRIVRNFDVRDIAEATALALMEDMAIGAP